MSKILKRQTGTADFLRIIDVGEIEPMKSEKTIGSASFAQNKIK